MAKHDKIIEIRGSVTTPETSKTGVRARIVLPASPFDRVRMRLYPESSGDLNALMQSWKATFEARRPATLDGSGEERIVCSELYMLSSSTNMVSHDIQHCHIVCDPDGIWHSLTRNPSTSNSRSHIVFRLTPNRQLDSTAIHTTKYDGSCEIEKGRQITIELVPGVQLTFDRHYVWSTDKRNDAKTRIGLLVALADVDSDLHEPAVVKETLLSQLDDLLLLASLGADHRTVCVGWVVSDDCQRVSRYDRGGVGRPSRRARQSFITTLIPLAHFENFIRVVWPAFQRSPYRDALRSVVYSIVPMHRRTLENKYLAMFSSLEELVLVFRRQNALEFTLPQDQWKKVESAIKQAIKSALPDSTPETRSSLYDKLRDVNRVSLRRAHEQFVSSLRVHLADLWPLFVSGGLGLAGIRDRLIHGDLDSDASVGPLSIATEHLRWTLQRIALSILGWPLELSTVRPTLLAADATAMQQLAEARNEFESRFKE